MRHSLRTEFLSSTMAHAPSCAKAAALPDGPTRFQVGVNGVVAHLGKLGKSEGAFPGVPGLAVADDAELDGIVAATQFGYCSQKPILGRTVRLDGNVEGVVPVEGDDPRVFSC